MPQHSSLAPASHMLPRGHRPRLATGHLADATGPADGTLRQSSRPPDHLETATDGPERSPDGLSRLPSELENAPTCPEHLPSDPEGSGAARRDSVAARREGRGGPRERGCCARGRACFVPEGRRGVATGGASRSDAEPVDRVSPARACPGGAEEGFGARYGRVNINGRFLCPSGAGERLINAPHGLRDAQSRVAPPVATAHGPVGAEERGHARVNDARARAGRVHAFAGEVPEAPQTARPSGISDAGGSGVRHGL